MRTLSRSLQYSLCTRNKHLRCPRAVIKFTLAATLSVVGLCTASLTSPKVPSPIVLLSTNCSTCRSLLFGGPLRCEAGAIPPPLWALERFAVALSTDALRRGAAATGMGACTIFAPASLSHWPPAGGRAPLAPLSRRPLCSCKTRTRAWKRK